MSKATVHIFPRRKCSFHFNVEGGRVKYKLTFLILDLYIKFEVFQIVFTNLLQFYILIVCVCASVS